MAIDKPYAVTPKWKVFFHDLGVDPARVLRRAQMPADLFDHDKIAVSSEEYFRLWLSMERESGDPLFPLRIGMMFSTHSFDPLCFAAFCSRDLNEALPRVARYKRLIAELALAIDISAKGTSLDIEWLDKTATPPPSLVLAKLVYFTELARRGTRTRIVPQRVDCPIRPAPMEPYTEYFGVAMRASPSIRLVFAAADAARPFITANEEMWRFFEPSLQKRLSDLDEAATTQQRVRSALLELLPRGTASMDAVAKKLGKSPRTVRRRLEAEGQTFQAILDRTRESLARHYLETTDMSGGEISFLLGFKDPNSFFRAFNAWTGTTPARARREMTQGRARGDRDASMPGPG